MLDLQFADRVRVAPEATSGRARVEVLAVCANYAFADACRAPILDACSELLDGGAPGVEVDLSRVQVMDSCGLGLLVALVRLASDRNVAVRLAGASTSVRKLLELTHLDRVFEAV